MNDMLNSALDYANQGLAVFPCKRGSKAPAVAHGFKDATTDVAQIKEWWTSHPEWNVAIATGEVSGGLVVIDVDMHGDSRAFEFIRNWEEEHGALKKTWITKTGTGGRHILYKGDNNLRNTTNADISIDVRATGGYIVAPPSIHPNKTAYSWYKKEGDIAEIDESVYEFLEAISKRNDFTKALVIPDKINKGARNDTLFRYCCSLQRQGWSNGDIWKKLNKLSEENCTEPCDNAELLKIFNSSLKYPKGTPAEGLERNNKKEVVDTLGNIVKILEAGVWFAGHFYYDERAFRNKVILPLPWDDGKGERMLEDVDYVQLRHMLEHMQNPLNDGEILTLKAKEKNIIDAIVKVSHDHRRNPLTEYLDSLEWDGVSRLDTLLSDTLGVARTDYSKNVMRLFALGAVSRAYNPGTKFDYIPVLVGSQGIGKSEFVKRLCPKAEWYLDNLTTMEGDQAIEKLENKWIVEVAELANLRRDKIESVKAFITQTQDTYRPKYARNAENRPRGVVFMGTTNSTTFLTDPTGNRRWLPLECGIEPRSVSLWNGKTTKEYFEQVWAEAVDIFKSQDISLVLDPALEADAECTRAKYTTEDPRLGIVEVYLAKRLENYTRVTKGCGDPQELRVCLKEIAIEALDCKDERLYNFNDIKALVEKIPNWQFHSERKVCETYGRQRYFAPLSLNEQIKDEVFELEKEQEKAVLMMNEKLNNKSTEEQNSEMINYLLKLAEERPSLIREIMGEEV